MNNTEKKMMVALAKIAINQAHLNTILLTKIPEAQRLTYLESQNNVERELDSLVALIRDEWSGDDKD